MSTLSLSGIQERAGRIEILLNKLTKNDEFETAAGKIKASLLIWYPKNKAAIVFDLSDKKVFKQAAKALEQASSTNDKFSIANKKQPEKSVPISKLVKTVEFGGKGAGAGLRAESAAMALLSEALENAIKENKGPISIKTSKGVIHDIVGVEKTPGTPKSDFHLIDSSNTPVIWISHKDGSSPKDVQQWGGISERVEPEINHHPETQKFIEDLKSAYPKGVGMEPDQPKSLYRKIKDSKIKFMSVYGQEFSSGHLGIQNITVLLQGDPGLKRSGSFYSLTASHVHYNGESFDGTPYEAVFMAVHKGDRSDASIPGTRLTISAIGGRKAVEFPVKD